MTAPGLPLVAIVGRPNVGKSTLFNHLTHSRRSLVGDEPGITRDRIYGQAEWRGRRFELVDTGGMLPGDAETIPAAIFRQAQVAIGHAAVVVFMVDGRTALAAPDLELARLLHRTGRPVLLAVNKLDSARQAENTEPYLRLGFDPVLPISAEHGIGVDDLLDRVLERLGDPASGDAPAPEAETRIAIIGRPNVGKSTLLNRLTGEERAIVSPIPGTTRDAVDAVVVHDGARYRIVDTAGLRRKGKTRLMAEKLSVVMARQHLDRSDLALIVLDASEPEEEGVLALDATIAGYAQQAARGCVLVVNKWDLARRLERDRADFEQRIRDRLKFLAYAPVVFVSAQTGAGMDRLFAAIERVAAARRKRVGTAELNRFASLLDLDRAPVPAGQRMKIYYLSQVATAPPRFVLFVDRARTLHFAFRRYLENQFRRAFGFEGNPLILQTRVSGKKRRS